MRGKHALILVALLVVLAGAEAARSLPSGAGGGEALAWLKARQNADGGFSEPGEESDEALTCWVMLAGAAGGDNPVNWKKGGKGPLDFLIPKAASLTELSAMETLALAMAACGSDPRNAGGVDLIAMIKAHISPEGKIGDTLDETSMGMIALAAAGEEIDPRCTDYLVKQQREDGAWGKSTEDPLSSTSFAVQALVSVGESSGEIIDSAMAFMKKRRNSDGGFGEDGSNTPQTSLAAYAIDASGGKPDSKEWDFHGFNAISYLKSMQAGDGHLSYEKGKESQPALCTAIGAIALFGKQLPPVEPADPEKEPREAMKDPALLGRMGAAQTSAPQPVEEKKKSTDSSPEVQRESAMRAPDAGVVAGARSWFNGFWVFLVLCLVYLVLLIVAGAVVYRLAGRKRTTLP